MTSIWYYPAILAGFVVVYAWIRWTSPTIRRDEPPETIEMDDVTAQIEQAKQEATHERTPLS